MPPPGTCPSLFGSGASVLVPAGVLPGAGPGWWCWPSPRWSPARGPWCPHPAGSWGVLLPALEVVVDLLLGLDLEVLCGVSSLCLLEVEALDLLVLVVLGVLDELWLSTLVVLECWIFSTVLDELMLSSGSG